MTLHYIEATSSSYTTALHIDKAEDYMSLVSISFPKSYFLVNDGTNTFFLDETEYTIPEGNYNISTFVSTVNNLITPSTVSVSNITGRLTLTSSETELIFPESSKLYRLFGCSEGSTNTIGGIFVSPNVINLQALNRVYICVDEVVDSSSHNFGNILSTIYVNSTSDFSNVVFINPEIQETARPLRKSWSERLYNQDFTFRFIDEDGEYLNLHGGTIVLCVKTFKKPRLEELLRNYIDVRLKDISLSMLTKS